MVPNFTNFPATLKVEFGIGKGITTQYQNEIGTKVLKEDVSVPRPIFIVLKWPDFEDCFS
jgi:hypothetical protein